MEQKKVTRDFKVLTEKISPDNVAVMAELIAMKETKILIADMVGFSQVSYFGKCFKTKTGHSPNEYREKCNSKF